MENVSSAPSVKPKKQRKPPVIESDEEVIETYDSPEASSVKRKEQRKRLVIGSDEEDIETYDSPLVSVSSGRRQKNRLRILEDEEDDALSAIDSQSNSDLDEISWASTGKQQSSIKPAIKSDDDDDESDAEASGLSGGTQNSVLDSQTNRHLADISSILSDTQESPIKSIVLSDDDDDGAESSVLSANTVGRDSVQVLSSSDEEAKPANDLRMRTASIEQKNRISSKPESSSGRPSVKVENRSGILQSSIDGDLENVDTEEIMRKIKQSRHLYSVHHTSLPDKGTALLKHIQKLEAKLNDNRTPPKPIQPQIVTKPRNSWDDIAAAANEIQPKHTGKTGLNTFNTHKTLTVDRLKQLHGSLATCPTDDMMVDQPAGLSCPLMNHQRVAIRWMMWRENQRPKGGILADDMGLGKTLTVISLVLCQLEAKNDASRSSEGSTSEDEQTKDRRRDRTHYGGTLVVCPASLINQWQAEVKQRVKRNLLEVTVHHGASREKKPKYLAKFDIVVTTYAILKNERASNVSNDYYMIYVFIFKEFLDYLWFLYNGRLVYILYIYFFS